MDEAVVPIADSSPYNAIAMVVFRFLDQVSSPEDFGSALAVYRTQGEEIATFLLSPATAAAMAGKTRFDLPEA